MDRSLVGTRTDACGNGYALSWWLLTLIVVVCFCTLPINTVAAADVAVAITVDADFVEFIRADRRARGIDAPDPKADERLARIAARLRNTPVSQQSAQSQSLATSRLVSALDETPPAADRMAPGRQLTEYQYPP